MDGPNRAQEAVKAALNSPLLEDNDISGARHILINITSGTSEVTMDEIAEITEYVQGEAGYDAETIWGSCRNEDLGERLAVTIIATGFDKDEEIAAAEPEKIVVGLDDHVDPMEKEPVYETGLSGSKNTMTFEFETRSSVPDPMHNVTELDYSPEPTVRSQAPAMNNARSHQSGDFKSKPRFQDPRAINELENQPAYLRKGVVLDDMPDRSESRLSDWTITGEDEPTFRKGNPFLTDNVD